MTTPTSATVEYWMYNRNHAGIDVARFAVASGDAATLARRVEGVRGVRQVYLTASSFNAAQQILQVRFGADRSFLGSLRADPHQVFETVRRVLCAKELSLESYYAPFVFVGPPWKGASSATLAAFYSSILALGLPTEIHHQVNRWATPIVGDAFSSNLSAEILCGNAALSVGIPLDWRASGWMENGAPEYTLRFPKEERVGEIGCRWKDPSQVDNPSAGGLMLLAGLRAFFEPMLSGSRPFTMKLVNSENEYGRRIDRLEFETPRDATVDDSIYSQLGFSSRGVLSTWPALTDPVGVPHL